MRCPEFVWEIRDLRYKHIAERVKEAKNSSISKKIPLIPNAYVAGAVKRDHGRAGGMTDRGLQFEIGGRESEMLYVGELHQRVSNEYTNAISFAHVVAAGSR